MLNAVARNQKKGNLEGRLFEMASTFIPKALPLTEYPDERTTLCVATFGDREDFYSLKGIADVVAENLYVKFHYVAAKKSFLHPYQTADILCGKEVVGYLGKVSYEVMEELDLRTDAYVMEIDLKKVAELEHSKATFVPLPKFPVENRDLALVMSKDITCGQVEEVIAKSCAYVKNIKLFDVYEGGQIPQDKRSMAFSLEFVPGDEAFEEDAVDRFVNKILKNLKFHLDIDLRS